MCRHDYLPVLGCKAAGSVEAGSFVSARYREVVVGGKAGVENLVEGVIDRSTGSDGRTPRAAVERAVECGADSGVGPVRKWIAHRVEGRALTELLLKDL